MCIPLPKEVRPAGNFVDSFATLRFPALTASEAVDTLSDSALALDYSTELSDEDLLRSICSQDRNALAALFRRYAVLVRGVAYRVLRNAAEADDLLQDIFLLVNRLSGNFDRSKGSARFWILQMTYRRAISRRRYLTSRHFYTHLDLDEAANQPGGGAGSDRPEVWMNDTIDRREALQNWFTELSESQRLTLHLFF